MAYATVDDAIRQHGERMIRDVSDHDRDGAIDVPTVEQALEDSSSEIDSYLAIRYPTPLPAVPTVVRLYTVEMAVYRMANTGAGYSEDLRKRYEDAVAFLKSIAAGKADLAGIAEKGDGAGGGQEAEDGSITPFPYSGETFR